jgi:hypothetical protein
MGSEVIEVSCLKRGWTPDLQTGRAELGVRGLITADRAMRSCRGSGLVLWRGAAVASSCLSVLFSEIWMGWRRVTRVSKVRGGAAPEPGNGRGYVTKLG